ncbi:hypothetical protein GCM10022409_43010 [Hymenobacter glaciei]|uniref:Secretion system C-terminal sorting domain-containing protein n=2 Tax=Hymenobacter glaciei TaxID=877209 RepID=A0ABP7USI0_9BACT
MPHGTYWLVVLLAMVATTTWAQTPTTGLIFKAATVGTPGAAVLDPNNDGYVSATSAGFSGTNDLGTASELPYRYLPQRITNEPMSDLRVGPSTKFTDFADVPGGGGTVGFYVDANSNYMFRFRLGGAAPNSKGYSIAIDTDNKFGFTGPNADPNAVAGNPGFEMEILLASNFGVRLYNIDGTTNPTDKGLDNLAGPDGSMIELPYASYAQKAIAATTNDGTLDVFYDFYMPLSVIQAQFGSRTFFNSTGGTAVPFSLSTSLRMVANTIIAPHSVTHTQNISDIGGINDTATPNTDNGFLELIGGFTPTSGGSLPPGGSISARTAPPVVSSPIQQGATSVSGTSTEAVGTVITVYVNGTALGTTTTVQAGGTWTLTGIGPLAATNLVKATATAPGKSVSTFSNEVQVGGAPACATATPGITCSGDRGIYGTAIPGATVYLRYPDGSLVGLADRTKNLNANPVIADAAGVYFFTSGGGNSTCTNGQPDALQGTYLVSQQAPSTTCESKPAIVCINAVATATPVVTTPKPITPTTTSIAGTAVTGAIVTLSIDGNRFSNITATTGTFNFTGATLPTLTTGRVLTISATANSTTCVSANVTLNVVTARTVVPPVVAGPLYTGGTTVKGTSVEAPGSTITLTTYSSLDGTGTATATYTTTVQADGTWSLTTTALVANSSVKATVTPTDYGSSGFSNVVPVLTRTAIVPTITGTYVQGGTSVTGTVPAGTAVGTVITIYEDGYPLLDANGNPVTTTVQAGNVWTLSNLSSGSGVAPNTAYPDLYAGGVLTATATLAGQAEGGLSNAVPVGCATLAAKSIAPTAICQNNATSFTVTNAEAGIIYTLQNTSNTTNVGASKVGTGTDLVLTTPVYSTAGTYPLQLNTFSVGAVNCQQTSGSVSLTVNPLPLTRTVTPQASTVSTNTAAVQGTNVVVQSSESGVSYQLTNASTNANVGSPQPGNGGNLNLPTGRLNTTATSTTYAVKGTNSTTGCTQQVGTATVNYTGPLPVELSAFDASVSYGDAVLTWTTASEKNSAYFAIERSIDGERFAPVGEVSGQGTSTQQHVYSFRDAGAARLGRQLYYRLRQVDQDGSTAYSPVRTVRFAGSEASATILLYPNPTATDVTCSLALLPIGTYAVQVLSLTGQVLSTTQLRADQPQALNLTDLPAGLYLVHVQSAGLSLTQRVVKLR